MNLKTFYQGLSREQRQRFADIAGTKPRYIEIHLLAPASRRKCPKAELMAGLAVACASMNSGISKSDLFEYFYESDEKAVA